MAAGSLSINVQPLVLQPHDKIYSSSESASPARKPANNANEALLQAVSSNRYGDFRDAIRNGAHAGVADGDGNTALHHAVRHSNLAVVKTLLRCGADPCVRNTRGDSALTNALRMVMPTSSYDLSCTPSPGTQPSIFEAKRKQIVDLLLSAPSASEGTFPDCNESHSAFF